MTETRAQSTYQVRLGWGQTGLTHLAVAEVMVVVDALGTSTDLIDGALALPHAPTVFAASLRNAAATAAAIHAEQLARGGRTAINLVLAGDGGAFAVEDYLVAGAIGDELTSRGIDHTAPDLAVAIEGFRPLTRAVKHLISASAAGLAARAEGNAEAVRAAGELNAESEAQRIER